MITQTKNMKQDGLVHVCLKTITRTSSHFLFDNKIGILKYKMVLKTIVTISDEVLQHKAVIIGNSQL